MGLQRNEPAGGGELAAQRGLLDGGERDVGGQGQIDAFALEGLDFDHRVRRLDQPAGAAEHVGHVVDGHLGGMQAVDAGARGGIGGEALGRRLLPAGVEIRQHLRKQSAALSERIGLRDPHGRFRRFELGVADDALLDKTVEVRRAQQFPPALRDVAAVSHPLAGHTVADGAHDSAVVRQIGRHSGRIRRVKIRSYGAACQHRDNKKSSNQATRPPSQAANRSSHAANKGPRSLFRHKV